MARYRDLPLPRRTVQLSVDAVPHGHRPAPLSKVACRNHALHLLQDYLSASLHFNPSNFIITCRIIFKIALPASIIPVVTCVAGGFIGWFLTSIIHYLCSRRKLIPLSSSTFSLAGTLVGIVLGWQATVTIWLFTIVVLAAMYGIERMLKKRLLVPETITFSVVAFLHHPFWRWLDGFW